MLVINVGKCLVVDTEQRKIFNQGVEIQLPELSYRLLICLIDKAPSVLSHAELMAAIWPDRVVSDDNLKKRVSRLREALKELPDASQILIAERGLGYRCGVVVTPVTEQPDSDIYINDADDSDIANDSLKKSSSLWPRFGIAVVAIFSVVSSIYFISDDQKVDKLASPKNNVLNMTGHDYAFQASQYYYQETRNDNEKALNSYKNALSLEPNESGHHSGLADVLIQSYAQFDQSIEVLQSAIHHAREAIALDPENAWGYQSLGVALFHQGKLEDAKKALTRAVELAPNWGKSMAYLSLAHVALDDLVVAYQLARKAEELDPQNPFVYRVLGDCLYKLGRDNRALEAFQKALSLNADSKSSHLAMANIALAVNDHELAKKHILTLRQLHEVPTSVNWVEAHLALANSEWLVAKNIFSAIAKTNGQYQLRAQIYLAILDKNIATSERLLRTLELEMSSGNQQPELLFHQAMLLLATGKKSEAFLLFRRAADNGFRDSFHYESLPIELHTVEETEFEVLKQYVVQLNRQKQLRRVPRKSPS